jgi:hypothetical protein
MSEEHIGPESPFADDDPDAAASYSSSEDSEASSGESGGSSSLDVDDELGDDDADVCCGPWPAGAKVTQPALS